MSAPDDSVGYWFNLYLKDGTFVKEVTDSMNVLSFFTCETKVWYGVMPDKENPDETFGYVRTEYVRKSGN